MNNILYSVHVSIIFKCLKYNIKIYIDIDIDLQYDVSNILIYLYKLVFYILKALEIC